jgi:CelD/BcsL family acetyltransferase involved in cellulose biosynthesis
LITNLTVTREDLESLTAYYNDPQLRLRWNLVFNLPAWLKVWWQCFSSGSELYLRSVRRKEEVIGIAPLQIREGTASIIGSVDVCDYQDFILTPGLEEEFFNIVLDDLLKEDVRNLHLETIRPDSTIVTYLIPIARARGFKVDYYQVDVSSDIALPSTWDEYLKVLDGKQRHEIKRKMRNLQKSGEASYRSVSDKESVPEALETFLNLFPESRGDKAEFMTAEMETFFRSMAGSLTETGTLGFGLLEIAGKTAAMVMYFDYHDNIYLYNSAYDPEYKSLSVGIISKASCIQDSIQKGKKRFDFLKGAEKYKSYLGGQEIPLYACHITLR